MGDDDDREALWRGLLTGGDSPIRHDRDRFKRWPGSPRCKTCLYPLGGPVARVLRLRSGRGPSRKNPNFCNLCEEFVRTHPGGSEVDVSLLFADVRGSTGIAESMEAARFSALMNRFFRAGTHVLIDTDGLIDKFVGDEVVGLYLPAMVADHPRAAIEAAQKLLSALGYGDPDGPWLPVGVGIHSGTAFVGSVGDPSVADFTAMGDTVNVAARLASAAKAGEILVSDAAWKRSGIDAVSTPTRKLEVKGRTAPVEVRVLRVDAPAQSRAVGPRASGADPGS
ncbi:MAG: adenylate/guanylate cyclase domain-containing protein [Actinomycetota bacterium]